ncbi:hypothetical protein GCM10023340_03110 [Nocardioides marinquilinus]|uniref:DUF4352 domain-containing protein n=1 Tax=Nocardioides marinquilinus TaxID=1210400 RepID=A0ABP9P772_9ACTN
MDTPRRTWGPFTGTHLTVMVVALVAALLVPVAAVSAGVARTAITSGNGKSVAGVSGGRLAVRTQPLGTLTTQPAPPTQLASSATPVFASPLLGCVQVLRPRAGRALVVQRINVNVVEAPGAGSGFYVGVWTSSDCSGDYLADVNPGGVGPETVDLGPGVALPAGVALYARATDTYAEVSAFGFSVPASAAPQSLPKTTSDRRAQRVDR